MDPSCHPAPFDLASDWNHRAGTRVSVKLSNGRSSEAATATPGFQMGRFALVELEGRIGIGRNSNMANEKTSKSVGTKASKILSNPKSSPAAKSVAASALTQRPNKSPSKKK